MISKIVFNLFNNNISNGILRKTTKTNTTSQLLESHLINFNFNTHFSYYFFTISFINLTFLLCKSKYFVK